MNQDMEYVFNDATHIFYKLGYDMKDLVQNEEDLNELFSQELGRKISISLWGSLELAIREYCDYFTMGEPDEEMIQRLIKKWENFKEEES